MVLLPAVVGTAWFLHAKQQLPGQLRDAAEGEFHGKQRLH
jgi:hypothetical protein